MDISAVTGGADTPEFDQPQLLGLLGNTEQLQLRGGQRGRVDSMLLKHEFRVQQLAASNRFRRSTLGFVQRLTAGMAELLPGYVSRVVVVLGDGIDDGLRRRMRGDLLLLRDISGYRSPKFGVEGQILGEKSSEVIRDLHIMLHVVLNRKHDLQDW
jgi:hypothetical protein